MYNRIDRERINFISNTQHTIYVVLIISTIMVTSFTVYYKKLGLANVIINILFSFTDSNFFLNMNN